MDELPTYQSTSPDARHGRSCLWNFATERGRGRRELERGELRALNVTSDSFWKILLTAASPHPEMQHPELIPWAVAARRPIWVTWPSWRLAYNQMFIMRVVGFGRATVHALGSKAAWLCGRTLDGGCSCKLREDRTLGLVRM